MMRQVLLISPLLISLLLTTGVTNAADPVQTQERLETKEQVYGYQLMTNEERMAFRSKMRAAKTEEEREKIQNEQHERMKIRAKERGVTLPDQPIMKGGGMGVGRNQGQGQGQGRRN
ncbi:MAG: hypothetical protein SFU55_11035 [Methylophilus sp.]|nr:hypothetical protein [Methylophilus sp.]